MYWKNNSILATLNEGFFQLIHPTSFPASLKPRTTK
jgi:hypothetical protein